MSDDKVVLATVNPWHKLVAPGDEFPTVEPTGTEMTQEQADAAVAAGARVNVALRDASPAAEQEQGSPTVTLVAPANTVVADEHSGQIFPAVTADGTTMTPEQAQAARTQAQAAGVELTEKE
jgi:hypothetical protein